MNRMCQALVAIAALSAAGIASAHGHGRFSIGFGFPIAGPVYAGPPVYAAPAPVYYVQPQVVYVAPAPVYYQPAYVYYPAPVAVSRPVPTVVERRSERWEATPAQPQPQRSAPGLPPRRDRG